MLAYKCHGQAPTWQQGDNRCAVIRPVWGFEERSPGLLMLPSPNQPSWMIVGECRVSQIARTVVGADAGKGQITQLQIAGKPIALAWRAVKNLKRRFRRPISMLFSTEEGRH